MLFRTISGKQFEISKMCEDDVCLVDIAHALSNICRYGGHVNSFYSVAEHCIHLCSMVPGGLEAQALLHDATEAYILDIVAPVKELLPGYVELENRVQSLIFRKFGLPEQIDERVLSADILIREYEMSELGLSHDVTPSPRRFMSAREMFSRMSGEELKHHFLAKAVQYGVYP